MSYEEYLESKRFVSNPVGLEYKKQNPLLFDFQDSIVRWALHRGKAAIFADCGLGKTAMQLTWANNINGRVIILAPLAVAEQTVQEGVKFGIDVNYCRSSSDLTDGINITNYEMLELKQSYFNQAVKNLRAAGEKTLQLSVIDFDSQNDDIFDCNVA